MIVAAIWSRRARLWRIFAGEFLAQRVDMRTLSARKRENMMVSGFHGVSSPYLSACVFVFVWM